MSKISINLLPAEILIKRQQSAKLTVINKISVSLLLLLIFFASATFALRLSQSLKLKDLNQNLVFAKDKVTSLESRESKVQIIKSRLSSIDKLSSGDSKLKDLFNLVILSVPQGIEVLDLSVTKLGAVTITLQTAKLELIESFFTNINSIDKNQVLVSKIDLDGFSLGKDLVYRVALKITAK